MERRIGYARGLGLVVVPVLGLAVAALANALVSGGGGAAALREATIVLPLAGFVVAGALAYRWSRSVWRTAFVTMVSVVLATAALFVLLVAALATWGGS